MTTEESLGLPRTSTAWASLLRPPIHATNLAGRFLFYFKPCRSVAEIPCETSNGFLNTCHGANQQKTDNVTWHFVTNHQEC